MLREKQEVIHANVFFIGHNRVGLVLIPKSERLHLAVGDCTVEAGRVVARLSERTLGLAFIDPEGFEVKLALFRALSKRPIDVLFLFPSAGIRRNLAQFMKQPHTGLDDLMGGREWRELPIAKLAAGKRVGSDEKSAFVRSLIPLFRARIDSVNIGRWNSLAQCSNVRGVEITKEETIERRGNRECPQGRAEKLASAIVIDALSRPCQKIDVHELAPLAFRSFDRHCGHEGMRIAFDVIQFFACPRTSRASQEPI